MGTTARAPDYVRVEADPSDRRSRLVRVTRAGKKEMARLQKVGIDRFALFVADWPPEQVRTLTMLLEKLEASKAAVAAREHPDRSPTTLSSEGRHLDAPTADDR